MTGTTATHKPHAWQRAMQHVSASRWGSWVLARSMHYVDVPLLALSGGRLSLPGLLTGLPVLTLTSTGARSGKPRTTPLVYVQDGDNVVLIASYFGSRRHPAWYYNLCAHPEVTLHLPDRTGAYVARELEGQERAACWRKAAALYLGYDKYQQRAGDRTIPVMLLTPKRRA